MANRKTMLIASAAALALVAGCKPKPKDLPPPPGDPVNGGVVDPNANGANGGLDNTNRARFQRETMGDTIRFALDDYGIDEQDRAILDSQAQWLARNPGVNVTIEGHADERGTREYNLALGDRRANAAKNYLAARGVNPARMTTISYGKERPIALGSDEASWAQNRRAVTVTVN